MPGGRPKVGLETLPETWREDILKLYKVGASDVEVKCYIWEHRGSFSNDLWDRWIKEEQEFSETIKEGKALCNKWWEEKGRSNLENRDFNYTGWYMNMKNRFGWKDKSEVKQQTEITFNVPIPTAEKRESND